MKRFLIFIFIFCSSFVYSQSLSDQLKESTIMLEKALIKIETLETEKATLAEQLEITIKQLEISNEALKKANIQIDKNNIQIDELVLALSNALGELQKLMYYNTIYLLPSYTISEGFGIGVGMNNRIAKTKLNIFYGVEGSITGKIGIFGGVGFSF